MVTPRIGALKIQSSKVSAALTFLFMLSSGITWTASANRGGLSGRLTIADAVGLAIVLLALITCFARRRLFVPREFRAYLPHLIILLIGAAFAYSVGRALTEVVVHLFIFVVAIALINIQARSWSEATLESLLGMLLWSGGILAVIGLAGFLLFPSLMPGTDTGLVGTFRNTGQAGAFFGVYLALIVPGFLSGAIRPTKVNGLLLVLIALALLFTVKRAALVGAIVGLAVLACRMMLSNSRRDKRYGAAALMVIVLGIPLLLFAFTWVSDAVPGFAWRFGRKVNASTVDDFTQGFFAENLEAAMAAFSQSPIIGVGLGNVGGIITDQFEIHSTYLSVLGNSGLAGVATYIVFMGTLVRSGLQVNRDAQSGRFLAYFMPMLVGLMVSWSYTYHLRKREFWILMVVMVIASAVNNNKRRGDGVRSSVDSA